MDKVIVMKYYLFILSCVISYSVSCQTWKRFETIKGLGNDYATGLETDKKGNIYVSGRVKFAATFGAGSNAQSPPQYGVETDAFIAKYDSTFQLKWVQRMGGDMPDWGHDIKVDTEGNVYTIGDFCDSAKFGTKVLVGKGADPQGDPNKAVRNAYIMKLDSLGNVLWVNGILGSERHIRGYDIDLDSLGNVYASGFGVGEMTVGSSKFGTSGRGCGWIVKYDPEGNLIWFKQLKSRYGANVNDIQVHKGVLFCTGGFKKELEIGSNKYIGENITWEDVYVTKLNISNGEEVNTKIGIGRFRDAGRGVFVYGDYLYLTGNFSRDCSFLGLDTIWTKTMPINPTQAIQSENGFLAKYTLDLDPLWIRSFGGKKSLLVEDIEILNQNYILISGESHDSVNFAGNWNLNISGSQNPFLLSFNSEGDEVFWLTGGSSSTDRGFQVEPYFGDVVFSGAVQSGADFGSINLGGTRGGWDAFFAQISMPYSLEFEIPDEICVDQLPASFEVEAKFSGLLDSMVWTYNGISSIKFGSFSSSKTSLGKDTLVYKGYYKNLLVFDSTIISNLGVGVSPKLDLGPNLTICSDSSTELKNTLASNHFNLWSTGETNQTITVNKAGIYWLNTSNDSICYKRDTINILIDECLSVNESSDIDLLTVAPNPCINDLIINTNLIKGNISVYSSTGIQVIEPIQLDGSLILNLSELNPGMYFLRYASPNCVKSLNFIKQ